MDKTKTEAQLIHEAWLMQHLAEVHQREKLDEELRLNAEISRRVASCQTHGHFWVLDEVTTDRWMNTMKKENKGNSSWKPPIIRAEWCARCEACQRLIAITETEKKPGPDGRPIEVTKVVGWKEAGEEKKEG